MELDGGVYYNKKGDRESSRPFRENGFLDFELLLRPIFPQLSVNRHEYVARGNCHRLSPERR